MLTHDDKTRELDEPMRVPHALLLWIDDENDGRLGLDGADVPERCALPRSVAADTLLVLREVDGDRVVDEGGALRALDADEAEGFLLSLQDAQRIR